jgi:hypothetical protein
LSLQSHDVSILMASSKLRSLEAVGSPANREVPLRAQVFAGKGGPIPVGVTKPAAGISPLDRTIVLS